MVSAATEFRKNSFSDSDSATLAKVATMFTNVADEAMSASDSASFIIAQMKAFGIEANNAQHIIDAVNAVSNNYAVSSGDLARNLGNMSAALAVGNNSFEESLALLTAGAEVTQNASKVSRALVTVQSRLNQVIDESSSTGKALTEWYQEHGIAILDQQGQLRSLYDVLTDVAEIWPTLTKNEQAYYLNQQAGANQTQNLSAILSNFETAQKAVSTALNSAGSAARENSAYMESLEAKQQALKAEFEDFANRVLSKDLVGGFINAGTAMLNFANNDVGAAITRIGVLSTGVTGLVGIVGQTVGKMAEVGLQLKNLGVGGDSFLGMLASGKLALIVGGTVAAITALVEIIKAVNQAIENNKFENLVADMDDANQELENTKTGYEETKKKLDELNNTPYDGNEAELQAEREQLEKQIKAYEYLIELRKGDAVEAARKVVQGKQTTDYTTAGLQGNTISMWNRDAIQLTTEQVDILSKHYENLNEWQEAAFLALQEYVNKSLVDAYNAAVAAGDMEEAYRVAAVALGNLGIVQQSITQSSSELALKQNEQMSTWVQYTSHFKNLSEGQKGAIEDLVTSTEDYYNALKTLSDNGGNLDQWQVDFINNWETLNDLFQSIETTNLSNEIANTGNAAEESASKLDTYIAALDQYRGANENAADASGVLVNSLFDANGQLTEAGKQALSTSGSMASMAQSFIEAQQVQAEVDFSALILAIGKVGEAAIVTTSQLASMMAMAGVDISGGETSAVASLRHQYYVETGKGSTSGSKMVDGKVEMQNTKEFTDWAASYIQKQAQEKFEAQQKEYAEKLKQIGTYVPTTGGGGGGSSSTKKDQEEVKAQTINTIEELREYLTDESTRLKLIDPDISKSDLQSTLSEVATIYQSYQDYLSQLKQQGFDETSDKYKEAEAEFAQFLAVLEELFNEIAKKGNFTIEELYQKLQSALGNAEELITKTVSKISNSVSSALDSAENIRDSINAQYKNIEQQLQESIGAAIDNAEKESEVAEAVADKYEWQNKLLEDKITLEEKLEALERAKQRRMLVYSEGRFQYMQDVDKISGAQAEYQSTYRDVEQSQIQSLLQMMSTEAASFFEGFFSEDDGLGATGIKLERYPEALRKHMMSLLREKGKGSLFENVSDEKLYQVFGSAMQPGEAYNQIARAYDAAMAAVEAANARKEEHKKQIREENVKYYGVDTDFGKKILESQSQEEAAYWTKLRDTKQQMIKEYREAYGDEAASKYFGTDVSKQDTWASNRDLYKKAWESQTGAWTTSSNRFATDESGKISQSGTMSQFKEITSDLLAAEYNVATALDFEGLGNQALYDKIFRDSITKSEIQDLYNKAQYDITKGYLLNLASEMKNNGASGYASGTRGASGGLSIVGENGPELRVLNQGDGILPNSITDNLWRWGSMTPSDMLSSLAQRVQNWAQTLNINNVTLPNVRDAQSFVSGLRELAQQYVTRRT